MARYAAFLRGINVAGRRIAASELLSRFEELGFRDVHTFRASGNVIFEADREPLRGLELRIEAALAESLEFEVATFLRTAAGVRAIAERQPFPPRLVEASDGKLQVMILRSRPASRDRDAVLALGTEEDRLALAERELYWLPSGGMRDSALDLKAIELRLGQSTMRTKGTLERIAAGYFG